MIKQIMIPAAAFLVTATSASAFFGSDMLEKLDIDLSDEQISALEEADEIRQEARDEAQAVLEAAGLDQEKMRELHGAMREARDEHREAMQAALETEDYDAFIEAIADTPMAELITSEDDFAKFVEAHELREAGEYEAAAEIMSELGLEGKAGMIGGHRGGLMDGNGGPGRFSDRQSAEDYES